MVDGLFGVDTNATLRERAVELARPEPNGNSPADLLLTITFSLAGEDYAIEAECAAEVRAAANVTRLPGVPAHVAGVFAVRGRVVPLVDPRVLLDLPPAAPNDARKIIIMQEDAMEFGLLVDSVAGVRNLVATDIHPPLPRKKEVACPYVRGIYGGSLTILDGRRLLADEHLVVDQETEG